MFFIYLTCQEVININKKYGLILLVIFVVLGIGFNLFNRYYTPGYIYNSLIKKKFTANPKVEVNQEKDYLVRIWYYPFFRTVKEKEMEEKFFQNLASKVKLKYPKVSLSIKSLNYLDGYKELTTTLKEGNPPDIYMNIGSNERLSVKYQLSVEQYLSIDEKKGFFTANWKERNHLWGWPFLVYQEKWLANNDVIINEQGSFADWINSLPEKSLVLNYYNPLLLKQLLTLVGAKRLYNEEGMIDGQFITALREVFNWLQQLRKKQVFAVASTTMEDYFLKEFLTKDGIVIGPVNTYLEDFCRKKLDKKIKEISLDNLVSVITLSIFRQKKYKGDDHTRVVMEVARILSEDQAEEIANDMGSLAPFYNKEMIEKNGQQQDYRTILSLNPEEQEYWQAVIIPIWLQFWKEGLTPEEVINKITEES